LIREESILKTLTIRQLAVLLISASVANPVFAAPPNVNEAFEDDQVPSAQLVVTEDDNDASDATTIGDTLVFDQTGSSASDHVSNPLDDKAAKAKKTAADKKKKEELQKKIAGAYKDPFFQNDFSYLNDPAYKDYHLGEGLKQLTFGNNRKLDIGGQYRLRYHHEVNMRGLGLTGRDDDFLLDRTRFYFDLRMSKRLRFYAEMLHAGSAYENFAPRIIEEQNLEPQNLFTDVVLLDSSGGKLTARGGRQELLLGAQRLLSPLDWANTRRTFDGGRLTWKNEDRTTDFLLFHPQRIQPGRFDDINDTQLLYGIYNSNTTFEHGPIDTYYLGFEDDVTLARVNTLGTLIKGEADNILWDNEFGYQFGSNPDRSSISAYSVTLGLGRRFSGESKPTLWMYYDWASGDDSVGNGWNHLFPLGHRYNGFMDLFGRRNLHDINSLFTVNPTKKLTLLAWYHYFALSNKNQGPYNLNMAAFNPGGTVGSRDLGHEIDLMATRKLNIRSEILVGYSHFFAGDYYSTSTTATGAALFNKDADFFYTQWHYNF
jgi:Alginate export